MGHGMRDDPWSDRPYNQPRRRRATRRERARTGTHVTDRSPDDGPPEPPLPASPAAASSQAETPRETDATPDTDRRAFLNQISHDAVWTAGRVAGFSAMVRRSLFAAGEAAVNRVSGPPGDGDGADGAPGAGPTAAATGAQAAPGALSATAPQAATTSSSADAASSSPPPSAAPDANVRRDPVAALSDRQLAFLAGMTKAVLAVNDPSGGPQVTMSRCHWDGTAFHLPAQQFTLRAANVERDPRVSLFVQDPGSGTAVAISGLATMIYGERVGELMRPILSAEVGAAHVERRWDELAASADRAIIEVIPNRFVWHAA